MQRWIRVVAWCVLALVALAVGALLAGSCAASRREVGERRELAPPTGRFVRAGDAEIYLQELGRADAPVVLLVHGTGAWSEAWRASMEALADGGFRAVAIDLPPFGFSERPANGDYSKAAQGARIASVLEALGAERAILVGHSFGGGPTVEAALLAPHRVRGLVLVDAALGIRASGEPAAPMPPAARAVLGVAPVRDGLVAGFLTNPLLTRRLISGFVFDERSVTSEWVRVYQRPLGVRGTTKAVGEWLPALVAGDPGARSEEPEAYAVLGARLVAIWGTQDSITPLEQGERLVALAPGSTLVRLDGVGHIPQIEAPAAFRAALVEAVARLQER